MKLHHLIAWLLSGSLHVGGLAVLATVFGGSTVVTQTAPGGVILLGSVSGVEVNQTAEFQVDNSPSDNQEPEPTDHSAAMQPTPTDVVRQPPAAVTVQTLPIEAVPPSESAATVPATAPPSPSTETSDAPEDGSNHRPPATPRRRGSIDAPTSLEPPGALYDKLPRKLTGNAAPTYPADAYRLQQQGEVVLRARIGKLGNVLSLRVKDSSGYDALDQSALRTVRKWRFAPARWKGIPVELTIDVPVRFRIRGR